MIYASGFFALALLVVLVAIYRQGKTAARKQALEDEHADIAKARRLRDRLRVDVVLVERLRARFRRRILPPL